MLLQKEDELEAAIIGHALDAGGIEHVCFAGVADGENLFFGLSAIALTDLPTGINTVDHVQTGAVVPVHQNGAGVVDPYTVP